MARKSPAELSLLKKGIKKSMLGGASAAPPSAAADPMDDEPDEDDMPMPKKKPKGFASYVSAKKGM